MNNKKVKISVPFLCRAKGYWFRCSRYFKEEKPQADVNHLVSRLRVKINDEKRMLSRPTGPEGRLLALRYAITGLIKYERVEMNYTRAHESQGYAERLISEAIRHGDCHIATMEMADYWLLEKHLIHKLFKVLVPRFEQSTRSYTRLFKAPRQYYGDGFFKMPTDSYVAREFDKIVRNQDKGILELKGNPFPPIKTPQIPNVKLLHNTLLMAAREEKRKLKVEMSLREQGLLEKSVHVQRIIAKSAASLQDGTYMGSDQKEIGESSLEPIIAEELVTLPGESKECADSENSDSSKSDTELNRISTELDSNDNAVNKNESQTKQSDEPSKPN